MKNKWLFIAALSGFFCVAFGAISAHAFEQSLPEQALIWIDKGLKYQFFHTLSLLALGFFQIANTQQNPPACRLKAFNLIGLCWTFGIVLFSGSLYALALGAGKAVMWATPVGGSLFLVGWLSLAYISSRTTQK